MSYQNRIVTVKQSADGKLTVACKIPFDMFDPTNLDVTHAIIQVPEGFAKKGDRLNVNPERALNGRYRLGIAGSGMYGDSIYADGTVLADRFRGRSIFKKEYDGESIVDLSRDISESLDEDFNPTVKDIPEMKGSPGFWSGKFVVEVKWVPDRE